MTCRELIDFLMSYLDGELPEAESRSFEEHLEICPDCANYLDSYRTTVALARDACHGDDDSLPAEIPEDLVTAVLDARRAG